MTLSTLGRDGTPSARVLILKHVDDDGWQFAAHAAAPKGQELSRHPAAALTFYWPPAIQVRVEGDVERVSDADADAYFATRPRGSQIGAWASQQSAELPSRSELDKRVKAIEDRFATGVVTRPPFWSGFRVVARSIEFWTRDPARLHERVHFRRDQGKWTRSLLYP